MKTQKLTRWALSRALSSASQPPPSLPSASAFPLKTVTKTNFEASLAQLRHHVRDSDFVAIDLEMTGITSAPWRESFEFDRSDVRYLKVKDSADKFAVVQFGVCPFRWDPSKQILIAYPHNFYVFPRQELTGLGPRYEFLCQTTSIDFLAKYQFDFNTCIHEGFLLSLLFPMKKLLGKFEKLHPWIMSGISYLSREQEDAPLVNMADVLFTERIKNKFSEWRDGLLRERNGEDQIQGFSKDSKQQIEVIFYKMNPALRLHGFTSHQVNLIKLVIRKYFRDLVYVNVNNAASGLQQMVVYTDSKDELKLLLKEVKDEHHRTAEMKIQAAVGFRHVIDLLSSEQKLIVGHNCFLDIAHVYSKFIGPLPRTAEEFVASVNKYFPRIVDTKILLNSNNSLQERMRRSGKSLASLFSFLCPQIAVGFKSSDLDSLSRMKVEVEVNDLRSSSWNPGGKHEAGYDAFMTGCVFAQLCSHLGVDFKLDDSSQHLALNENIQKCINLLYLSWMHGDIIDLNTELLFADQAKAVEDFGGVNIYLIWIVDHKKKARKIEICELQAMCCFEIKEIYHIGEENLMGVRKKLERVMKPLWVSERNEKVDKLESCVILTSKIPGIRRNCFVVFDAYEKLYVLHYTHYLHNVGVPTIAGKSKSESKDKEKKHKKHKDRDKEKDKEHKKHKHRHKDRSKDKDKDKKKDKSGHQDSSADHAKKHHEKVEEFQSAGFSVPKY
ncbi:poly(A)-specific ribonuclease PARN isoform X1 [Senna tora]|uniref:Poly(A)-specific ribonuclease PARN isoform X1 n=1 Tax=Senna tora TaxID=362788 RepID=A0A834U0W0_9FABA|nr:poly(A)-specific ribonuclease PARN isoform X1 [Senna tora]